MPSLKTSKKLKPKHPVRFGQTVPPVPFKHPTGIARARQVGGQARALGHQKQLLSKDRNLIERSHPNPPEFQKYGKEFDKRVSYGKDADKDARKKMVDRLVKYEYGDNQNWRKRVYGKNYKFGTLKNLNTDIQGKRSNIEELNEQISGFRGKLESTTDETALKALRDRISRLEGKKNESLSEVGLSKEQRDKLLAKRDKALRNVYVNMKSRGKAGEQARRRAVRKSLSQYAQKPDSESKTVSTGAKSPNMEMVLKRKLADRKRRKNRVRKAELA